MRVIREYYDDDGSPKKCFWCNSTQLSEVVKETIEGTVSQYSVICDECEECIGYWAYGHYDPYYKTRCEKLRCRS